MKYFHLRDTGGENLQLVTGQVQCDAAHHILPVFEVTKEPDSNEETGHHGHCYVENSIPSSHTPGGFHLVLQRQHNANALEGKNCSSKEQRELGGAGKKNYVETFYLSD